MLILVIHSSYQQLTTHSPVLSRLQKKHCFDKGIMVISKKTTVVYNVPISRVLP
jgi:hypothetical protein